MRFHLQVCSFLSSVVPRVVPHRTRPSVRRVVKSTLTGALGCLVIGLLVDIVFSTKLYLEAIILGAVIGFEIWSAIPVDKDASPEKKVA
jgi:hypothetical protein